VAWRQQRRTKLEPSIFEVEVARLKLYWNRQIRVFVLGISVLRIVLVGEFLEILEILVKRFLISIINLYLLKAQPLQNPEQIMNHHHRYHTVLLVLFDEIGQVLDERYLVSFCHQVQVILNYNWFQESIYNRPRTVVHVYQAIFYLSLHGILESFIFVFEIL